MKKLITIIMVLALFLPAAVIAEEPDCDAAYVHIEMNEKDHDAPFIAAIKFAQNNTCYYCEQTFYSDRPGQSNALIGTWEMTSDGEVLVKLGNLNAAFTLHFLKDGGLINTDTMMIYYLTNAIWK